MQLWHRIVLTALVGAAYAWYYGFLQGISVTFGAAPDAGTNWKSALGGKAGPAQYGSSVTHTTIYLTNPTATTSWSSTAPTSGFPTASTNSAEPDVTQLAVKIARDVLKDQRSLLKDGMQIRKDENSRHQEGWAKELNRGLVERLLGVQVRYPPRIDLNDIMLGLAVHNHDAVTMLGIVIPDDLKAQIRALQEQSEEPEDRA